MSEEKMQEAFKRVKGCEMKDAMACAARDFEDGWKAALKFADTNSESEAGAVAYRYRWKSGGDRDREWGMWSYSDTRRPLLDNQVEQQLYAAPPSAQAIETAAYMRAMKVVDGWASTASEYGFDGDMEQFMRVNADIEALIPQDGRTQLEQKCMEVAVAVRAEVLQKMVHCHNTTEVDLRAIVNQVMKEVGK